MLSFISTVNDAPIKNVLLKLFSLYGTFSLEKHLQYLYQGGYGVGPQLATLIQDSILKLCSELKDDAIALIDVVAPPDFLLKSALGASDGEVRLIVFPLIYMTSIHSTISLTRKGPKVSASDLSYMF